MRRYIYQFKTIECGFEGHVGGDALGRSCWGSFLPRQVWPWGAKAFFHAQESATSSFPPAHSTFLLLQQAECGKWTVNKERKNHSKLPRLFMAGVNWQDSAPDPSTEPITPLGITASTEKF